MSDPIDRCSQPAPELGPTPGIWPEPGATVSNGSIVFDPDVPPPSGPDDYGFYKSPAAVQDGLGDHIGVGALDAKTANVPQAKLHSLDLAAFLRLELPPRLSLLRPWLPQK